MVINQEISDIKKIDKKKKKDHSLLAGFEPRISGTWGENAATAPQNPQILEEKKIFTHWARKLKFCPKCPFDT